MSHARSAMGRVIPVSEASEHDVTHLRGRWLALARIGWVVAAVVILGMDLLGTPAALLEFQTACVTGSCPAPRLTPDQLRQLVASGMAPGFYAAYFVALNWLGALVFVLVGVLIIARRSADRMALFGAYMLLTFGGAAAYGVMVALPDQNMLWWLPVNLAVVTGQVMFYVFFCLFPSGHFVPRWIRWAAVLYAGLQILAVVPLSPLESTPIGVLMFVAFIAVLIVGQVYRHRRVSTHRERQQTKWVVAGFVVGIGIFTALLVYGNVVLGPGARDDPRGTLVANTIFSVLICLVPICIGIAILRSGLWDVDVLINRTLVYGSLTLLLAAVYFGSVAAMQAIATRVTGQRSLPPPAIVASTLLIAALFQPLRRRLQHAIDRRFFRGKYDTAKTLADFGDALRREVDLPALEGRLLSAVDETMRPTHVSLWLQEPAAESRAGAPVRGGA